MKPTTISQIRISNLRLLIEEVDAINIGADSARAGTAKAVALRCNTSASLLSQILTRNTRDNGKTKEIGTDLARKLEKGCGKPEGWMDVGHGVIDPKEEELRTLFAAMNDELREGLLAQARLFSKIEK